MTRSSRKPEIVPLVAVLAAGRAVRFGGGKLDSFCAGKRLGHWTIDAVADAGLAPGVIVTAPEPPVFASETDGWNVIRNARAESGLASSLVCAVREASARGAPALLVLLADMPLIPAKLLHLLATSPAPAATRYPHARPGAPALIPARLYHALAALSCDRGAATVLAEEPDLHLLEAAPEWLMDVDTPEDLARAETVLRRR